jgi:hypothetical protein
MNWNYEIGCSLMVCENEYNVSLYVYNNKCRENILIGFCGKLIRKFAFSYKIVELKSFKNWVLCFLNEKDKNKNKYFESYGNDEYKVYETLKNEGDDVNDIATSIIDEETLVRFKIMIQHIHTYLYSFLLENLSNGIVEVTNDYNHLLRETTISRDGKDQKDYGKMIINAMKKIKKLIKYIRKLRKGSKSIKKKQTN